jgi:metal-responsive CopG/Arc/MetJ family transcriptional regulator
MEKRTILVEISAELIDKIDQLNTMGDRSEFISHLLNEQIERSDDNKLDISLPKTNKINEE